MTETVPSHTLGIDDPLAGYRIVHRTIMRPDAELDIRPLYVGGLSSFGSAVSESRQSGSDDANDARGSEVGIYHELGVQPGDDSAEDAEAMGDSGSISGVFQASAKAGRRLTFGTYFNAFPASYWRRWTDFTSVRLVVVASGEGTIIVYRSTSKGHVQRADSVTLNDDAPATITFDLELKPFIDGGWYWFDAEAGERSITVEYAVWAVETDKRDHGIASIGITTFNRPEFCVDQLVNLGQQPEVLAALDTIYVIDQGTKKVSDDVRYEGAAAVLGSKLQLIEQGNLGGSGGFSRAMDEATSKGVADYVLLLDDDVVCEPEGILRAITFADLARTPTIVGGHMFSLYDRSVLHTFGEKVAKWRWFWGPAPGTEHGHNFARRSLRSTRWLHLRCDVDYNGWWMCLIPTKVIDEIGLSLPMFIKWDDAEFGLRAADAGYPTVSLPGVAVWHVPWHEKDDTIDWQAYFHRRNRIIAALLHSPYEYGGKLVRESLETQLRHLLSMQYGPAQMGLMAIEDILDGPERMHRDVLMRLSELRELRKTYDDSIAKTDLDGFPTPKREKPPRRGRTPQAPQSRAGYVKAALLGAVRQFTPVREMSREHPEAGLAHVDLKWWLLAQLDSALVSSADGTSVSWYKRDPRLFNDLAQRSVKIHARLLREWPALAQEYKASLADLSSPQTWRKTFDESVEVAAAAAAAAATQVAAKTAAVNAGSENATEADPEPATLADPETATVADPGTRLETASETATVSTSAE